MITKTKTILVVDDDPEIRRDLRTLLGESGYGVLDKEGGGAALTAIRGGAGIDLVITDYQMPDMDGHEFVMELRKELPNVPVIMITGFGTAEYYLRSLSLGVYEYLHKPVDKKELMRLVRSVLGEAKSE